MMPADNPSGARMVTTPKAVRSGRLDEIENVDASGVAARPAGPTITSRKLTSPAIMSFTGWTVLTWRSRPVASMTHRVATRLAGGCALLLAVSLSGCAAPQYTDVSDSGANVHFKIPRGWDQISGPALASELRAETGGSGGSWTVAYEANHKPTAADFLSFGPTRPFLFAEFGTLTSTASREMSYRTLRDFFLPVTSTGRQNAVAQGFPLTGFRQIRDQMLTLGQGGARGPGDL